MNYPHDIDLENIVLGTIISNASGYNEIRDIVNEDCFYNDFNKKLFQIFKEVELKGEQPDAVIIAQEYRKKYSELKVVELMKVCDYSSMTNLYSHTCRLNDLSTRRKFIDLGIYLQSKGQSERDDILDISSYAGQFLENIWK